MPEGITRYTLRNTVVIDTMYPPFRGWKMEPKTLIIEPAEEPGWFWRAGGDLVPLSPKIIHANHNFVGRFLELRHKGCVLRIPEHLMFLRCMGLDGIVFEVTDSKWLPGDGTTQSYLNALRPHMKKEGVLERYTLPKGTGIFKGTNEAFVHYFGPSHDLTVSITVDYSWKGKRHPKSAQYLFPRDFQVVSGIRTQGWPPRNHWLAVVAHKLRLNAHLNSVVWPQKNPDWVEQYNKHRALDFAAYLSFLAPVGTMLTGTFVSYKAGHRHDKLLVDTLAQP